MVYVAKGEARSDKYLRNQEYDASKQGETGLGQAYTLLRGVKRSTSAHQQSSEVKVNEPAWLCHWHGLCTGLCSIATFSTISRCRLVYFHKTKLDCHQYSLSLLICISHLYRHLVKLTCRARTRLSPKALTDQNSLLSSHDRGHMNLPC